MMELRGVEYGNAFNASGARNFFGHDSYWFHALWNLGLSPLEWVGMRRSLRYERCTFVSKTTTVDPRTGNMPLVEETTKPRELMPKCIIVKPLHGVVLNKVGLSGPGAKALLERGYWQERVEPFVISFMAVAATRKARLQEAARFSGMIMSYLEEFCAPFALEINFSCPNVGHEQAELIDEVEAMLDLIGRALPETPLIPKFNIRLLPAMAVKIAEFPQCDAITVSNTIPWGAYPERIPWEAYFGSSVSPLEGLGGPGGGGLSGAPLLPFLIEWLNEAVHLKIGKPIIACGGILSPRDVRRVLSHGASAIQVGSASILRPWRVQPIIDEANRRIR